MRTRDEIEWATLPSADLKRLRLHRAKYDTDAYPTRKMRDSVERALARVRQQEAEQARRDELEIDIRITKSWIKKFKAALKDSPPAPAVDGRIFVAQREGMVAALKDLESHLASMEREMAGL